MPDNSSSNKRIAKNSIFLSIRMIIVLLISLYTTRVVLHVLGVEDYGVYNVVCGFVTMFAFLNTSMSNGIQRFYNFEYGKNGEKGANCVYCTAIYIQAMLAIIVIVIVEAFGLWYLHNKMVIPDDRMVAAEWIFQFAILSFVLGIMQAPFAAAVTAHERFNFYAIISVLDAVLKLGIVFLLQVISIDKLVLYGFLMAIISVINILFYYIYCKKCFPEIQFHIGLDRIMFKKMLGFSGWNLFGSFSGVMKEQGINLVLNFYYGPIVNAARGVAMQINGAIMGFVNNILTPVRPQVVQSYAQGDIRRTMSLTYSVSKFGVCFLLLMAVPASIEIKYVLQLWLGDSVPDHTATFSVIVLFTSMVGILNGAISGVVHATGIMKQYQIWGSLIGISSVPLSYILLKFYSLPEIALFIVLICAILSHIICLFIVRKLVGLSLREYFYEIIVRLTIVTLVSFATGITIHLFIKEGITRLIIVTFVSVIGVFLSSFFIAFNKNEKAMVLQLASNVTRRLSKK